VHHLFLQILAVVVFVFAVHGQSHSQETGGANKVSEQDLGEISRQLDNPLTSLWSLTFENKTFVKEGDIIEDRELANTLFFQPGLPIPVGKKKDKVFIARPVFPLVTNPVLDSTEPDGVDGHTTGLGDIQMLSLLGPNRKDGVVWGAGATFKFPTASEDALGQDKYQAGPAAMLFSIGKPWVLGALWQHWWSYAGDDDAPDTSQTDLQYVIRYALPNAWSIGMGPTISVNWEADSDNRWTVPVGFGGTKTVRFGKTPVKFRAEVHYSVIRPDDFGTEWTFIFRVAPVIPSPFR
jgi:hypothetical protein